MPIKEIPFKSYMNGPSPCVGITNPLRAVQLTFFVWRQESYFWGKGVGTSISHPGGGGIK